jgi:hypothetical protein
VPERAWGFKSPLRHQLSRGHVLAPSLDAGAREMAYLSTRLDSPTPLDADEVVADVAGAFASVKPPIPLTGVAFDSSSLAGRTDVSRAVVDGVLDRLDPSRIVKSFPRDNRGWPASGTAEIGGGTESHLREPGGGR